MNVLFISNIVTPYQLDFLRTLDSKGGVRAFGYFAELSKSSRAWNLDLPRNVFVGTGNSVMAWCKIVQLVRAEKITHIVVGGYSLVAGFVGLPLAVIKKIKLYYWLERPLYSRSGMRRILKELHMKMVFSCCNGIFAIGSGAAVYYRSFGRSVFNLPYSFDLTKYLGIDRKSESPGKRVRFLFSGQYIDRKNVKNLVLAFKEVSDLEASLTLIGGGALEQEIDKLIGGCVHIEDAGFIQPEALPEVFSNHDVFILP